MSLDICGSVGPVSLKSCLYNASGARCASTQELHALGQSQAGAILSKSCTLEPRLGNPSPRYIETHWGSINSMGLPNEGWAYYAHLAESLDTYSKPYIMSVSGLSLEENTAIIRHLAQDTKAHISALELNLSCPNVPGKPQTGYDFEQVRRVLDQVCPLTKQPLGVKLPPYFDLIHFEIMAQILQEYPLCFVTCVNSIGNGLVIDPQTETVVIKPKGGFGGIGGDFIKPTALANVRQFRLLLPPRFDVIGCGGVRSGTDAFEHLLCGASAVQIGTQLMREDTPCFERIAQELQTLMQSKGYTSVQEFRGKLQTL